MMQEYLRALISAPTEEEAKLLLKTLLNERLIAGGLITKGLSHYWWKGKINEKQYYNLSSFTIKENKETIIQIVERLSKDETPIISFFRIDYASDKTLNWIKQSMNHS